MIYTKIIQRFKGRWATLHTSASVKAENCVLIIPALSEQKVETEHSASQCLFCQIYISIY